MRSARLGHFGQTVFVGTRRINVPTERMRSWLAAEAERSKVAEQLRATSSDSPDYRELQANERLLCNKAVEAAAEWRAELEKEIELVDQYITRRKAEVGYGETSPASAISS